MDKDSLIIARRIVIESLNKVKAINPTDRAELMMNLWKFLDNEKYEENIKVLRKHEKKR